MVIIDKIGKNISGSGLDTNVVGRKFHDHKAIKEEYPKVTRIYVRDLTDENSWERHGNRDGRVHPIRGVVKKMDFEDYLCKTV